MAIKDVAAKAEVSTATVSRYLNGKFNTMSEATRRRIEETIVLLGYKPSHVARSLRSSQSKTIGVILADILNPYSVAVLQGIEETAAKHGYSIIVCNTNESGDKELDYIEMLVAKQVDGFVINTTGRNNDLILQVSKEIPIVLIGRKIPNSFLDSVSVNNTQGTMHAFNHLLSRECKSIIMMIPTPGNISPRIERAKALNFLSNQARQSINTEVYNIERYDITIVTQIINRLAKDNVDRIGLITGNGILSMLTLKAIRELGYKIPKDFLMVGFDDPDWASITEPTLTVIAQPTYTIGERAVELLLSRLTGKALSGFQSVELNVELIERGSSCIL